MYGAIRDYTLQPGTAHEALAKILAEFVPLISDIPGLLTYTVIDINPDAIVTVSIFESEEAAETSVKLAADWVKENLANAAAAPPRVTVGEISVREVAEHATEGYCILRRFKCTSADAPTIAQRVRDGLLPVLDGMPGFAQFAILFERGGDHGGASLSAFVDRASAEAANAPSLAWVKENVGMFLTAEPEVRVGEVKVHHVATPVGAPQRS